MHKGLLFDLDGVIVDTAKYHYLAWKDLADKLEIPFTKEENERLKGVSRLRSFEIILEIGNKKMTQEEKEYYCTLKNDNYLKYIMKLEKEEILPGVKEFLNSCKEKKYKIALGSASKNSMLILERLELLNFFDDIVDGTKVSSAKPNPEVFIKGAEKLGLEPKECIVFEDAAAGIEAAHRGGMKAVGIGDIQNLPKADIIIPGFTDITIEEIEKKLKKVRGSL